MTALRYGFRIVGDCTGPRRLVVADAAFAAYAACDERAQIHGESYLSAFQFGDDFQRHLKATGSTKGFIGACGASALWFDIDRKKDLRTALDETRRLAVGIVDRFNIADGDLLIFFSGSKGFHVGVPTALWQPSSSMLFHRTARQFAEHVAMAAGVTIDLTIYDKVHAFRAPNSRHPKTGLHKRSLTFDELMELNIEGILTLASAPVPFEVLAPTYQSAAAAEAWNTAEAAAQSVVADRSRQRDGVSNAGLNRATLDFIRDGAAIGDRHRLLYSSSANLAEFNCPPGLVHALLTPAALDSGLAPAEVRRCIDNALSSTPGIAAAVAEVRTTFPDAQLSDLRPTENGVGVP